MGKSDWILLHLKLREFKFSEMKLLVRRQTPLSTIVSAIEERHGRIEGLQLWKNFEAGPLRDYSMTLASLGWHGALRLDPQSECLFYDFQPAPAVSNAVLNRAPNFMMPPPIDKYDKYDKY